MKIAFFIGLLVAAFYIPKGSFGTGIILLLNLIARIYSMLGSAFLIYEYAKQNEQVIGDNGKFTHLLTSLRCKLLCISR